MSTSTNACTGCGAPLPVALQATRHVCGYCGREQLLGPPPPAALPYVPSPFVPAPPIAPAPRRTAFIVPFIVLGLAAAGGAAFYVKSVRPSLSHGASGPGSGGYTPSGEHLQWDTNRSTSVVVTDVNGDGIEDFIGRYRLLDSSTQTIYVGAFDGKTLERLWAAGPFGTLEQGNGATHFAVAGGKVVVTDFRAQAHVLELRTGKETASLALSDRAKSACSPNDTRAEVWIEVADGKHVVADVGAGRVTPSGAKPAWCGVAGAVVCEGPFGMSDACGASTDETLKFQSAGLIARQVLRAGSLGVAVGMKHPGTATTLAIGFDPKTLAVRWQAPVAADPTLESPANIATATLVAGRLVTSYATTSPKETRVVALDAATGKRMLDVPLPRAVEASPIGPMIVSSTRIYVPHWTWLDVFDLRDGKLVGTVGIW